MRGSANPQLKLKMFPCFKATALLAAVIFIAMRYDRTKEPVSDICICCVLTKVEANMSCSSKSESARERDPRKHASTASRCFLFLLLLVHYVVI